VRAVLVVIRVLQALVVRLGQVELLARMVWAVQQSRLVVTVAMVVTGTTRAVFSTQLLERRAVPAVTVARMATAATAATAAAEQSAPWAQSAIRA
jgi:hypothetical protein